MAKYLDENGLLYFWGKIKAAFVAKESGKGLSTNDYTTTEKNKLANIAAGAQVNVIETVKVNGTALSVTSKAVDVTVPTAGSTTPKMDGTGSAGSASTWSKSDHVHPTDTSRAPLASPTFTGTPKAPTASSGDSSTQIATTAFVSAAISDAGLTPSDDNPAMDGTAAPGISTDYSRADHVHPTDTSRAASTHTHGNVTNAGAITATGVTIASGDAIVLTDASASGKLVKSSITFDGSTTTKALTQKGTWEEFAKKSDNITGTAANVTGTVAVANGGTGATDAETARTNLGITPANIGAAASSHTHGNILNGGTITATGITLANGDALLVADSSGSGKIEKTSITFDGSTTTQALTKKGTWGTFLTSHQSLAAYAPLASPALTGTPTAPTATAGTNTTQIATTAFVKTAVDNAIGSITGIEFRIVESLPATGENGVIYLVAHSHGTGDAYDEYIWVDGAFEKIGNTDIDLSGYWAKADLVAITNAEIDTIVAA